MVKKDLRPEQVTLLRFEKLVENVARDKAAGKKINKAPLIAALPFMAASGAIAAQKLGDDAPLRHMAELDAVVQARAAGDEWLVQLAEVVSKGHVALERLAENGVFLMLEANGTPKRSVSETVQSLLANGLL